MRKPQGYGLLLDPGSDVPLLERDTITCGHCQRIVHVKPGTGATTYLIFHPPSWAWREEAGAACRVCMRPVCLACHDLGTCTPWERQLEAMEAKDRLVRAVLGG
jgi:hypothetical protein